MSETDYQALREAAENATWGDWDSYKPHRGARGYEVRLSSQAIAQHVLKNNAEFIAAFNPKVALALLDERERNQQYIKSRDQENEDIALTVGRLRVELEAAENNLIDSECHVAELEEALRDKQALLEASEKRIAELEAELVSQTYKLNKLSGNSPVTPDGWVMVPKEPTQAMIKAWLSEIANFRGHAAGYRAALEAAPQLEVNRG